MSLRQHARRTTRTLANAFIANYGRYMQYSRIIDKINRRPLLHGFTRKIQMFLPFPLGKPCGLLLQVELPLQLTIWNLAFTKATAFYILQSKIAQPTVDFSASIALPGYRKIGTAITSEGISILAVECRKQSIRASNSSSECSKRHFLNLS